MRGAALLAVSRKGILLHRTKGGARGGGTRECSHCNPLSLAVLPLPAMSPRHGRRSLQPPPNTPLGRDGRSQVGAWEGSGRGQGGEAIAAAQGPFSHVFCFCPL